MSAAEATVDLAQFYPAPKHRAAAREWNRTFLRVARWVGNALLDVLIVVATFAVVLVAGSSLVDYLLFTWRH